MTELIVRCHNIDVLNCLHEYTSLYMLDCSDCNLTELPELPASLKVLHCENNNITTLPKLPSQLIELWCQSNNIAELPPLPKSMQSLFCSDNMLTHIDVTNNLKFLACAGNQLTKFSHLPSTLGELWCEDNMLEYLPALPSSLNTLSCDNNRLVSLPAIGSMCRELSCRNNRLTSLPTLPYFLQTINCDGNPFKRDINMDINNLRKTQAKWRRKMSQDEAEMLGLDRIVWIRKEPYIIDLVKKLFPTVEWSVNCCFDSSLRRPDLMVDVLTHIVVVEIDENQHKGYKPSAEKCRIDEICTAVNDRPIVFIRFNPDNYERADGKKIKTCWNCDGIIDDQQLQWQNRVTVLECEIRKWLVTVPSTLEIIQLFYDGWNR